MRLIDAEDLISRQAAIDEMLRLTNCRTVRELNDYTMHHKLTEMWSGGILDAIDTVIGLPSAHREIERLSPCDVCKYTPPSAMDGKPCAVCPAEGKETEDE